MPVSVKKAPDTSKIIVTPSFLLRRLCNKVDQTVYLMDSRFFGLVSGLNMFDNSSFLKNVMRLKTNFSLSLSFIV